MCEEHTMLVSFWLQIGAIKEEKIYNADNNQFID